MIERSNELVPSTPPTPVAPSITRTPVPEILSQKQLELEQRFNILFLTPQRNEELKLAGFILNRDPSKPSLVKPWDNDRLSVFERILPVIPESFYDPRTDRFGDTYPLIFALMSTTESSRQFAIAGETRTNSPTYPLVVLTEGTFRGSGHPGVESESTLVHELQHYFNSRYKSSYNDLFHEPTGMSTTDDLARVFASIITPNQNPSTPVFRSISEYGTRNQEEFLAVASEHYFLGWEVFMYGLDPRTAPLLFQGMSANGYFGYARFLGVEKAQALYGTFRDKVYAGREYQFHQLKK